MSSLKWIWLADRCGVASSDLLALIARFGDAEGIYRADYDSYVSAGISERIAERLGDKELSEAYAVESWCSQNGVGILCFDDKAYPTSLRALKNPPAVLYYIGRLPDFNRELCISVVGTRTVGEYGKRTAYKIAYEMASAGAVIISGMALGIDGISSCAAVAAGGRTVAVLGSGIDCIYPKEHKTLMRYICRGGAIITEYPPSTPPHGYNFPIRNRIISGLGIGTLVVDAPNGSGALITAKNAILQGKDIYAVPGNIDDPNMTGTNSLIRDGATAVLCGRDVIKGYAFLYRDSVDMQKLTYAEAHSDYDEESIRRMGVSMRVRPTFAEAQKNDIPREKLTPRPESKTQKPEGEPEDIEIKSFKEKKKSNSKKKVARTDSQSKGKSEPKAEGGDMSESIIKTLTERQAAIFSEMPLDTPVTLDHLVRLGFGMGEVMSALTVLEIKGLVSSLPGALYIRK